MKMSVTHINIDAVGDQRRKEGATENEMGC